MQNPLTIGEGESASEIRALRRTFAYGRACAEHSREQMIESRQNIAEVLADVQSAGIDALAQSAYAALNGVMVP